MKSDQIKNVPMFDVPAPPPLPPKPKGQPFGARNIRRVLCAAGAHMASVILSGDDHLIWRDHQIHTTSGSTWPCSASGKDLCDAPAPDVKGVLTPLCERPAGRGWVA